MTPRSSCCSWLRCGVINRNKPNIEIMAKVYSVMIKYIEIELILTNELFGNDNTQFPKIIGEALSLVGVSLFTHSLALSLINSLSHSHTLTLSHSLTHSSFPK